MRSSTRARAARAARPARGRTAALSFAAIGAVATLTTVAPLARAQDVRRLRVSECVDLALKHNVDVQSATEGIAVEEARRSGARGLIGPRVRVDAYAREWTEPYTIPFQLDPTKPPSAFPVHEQFEWNATVTVTQPITGLLAIIDAYKVRSLGVDVATIQREVSRRETTYRVVESYYHLLQAERLAEVAAASVEQLQTQLRQSQSFHDNGVVSQDDVLRAQLAVANAQQRQIQVRARVSLEQARLGVLIGLPSDAQVDALALATDRPAADAISLDQASLRADAQRVELAELDKRIEVANREVKLAWLKLAPQVSAVGAYIHNEGSLFSQTNSAYVGGVASWDVWDWGATSSGIGEAKARTRQAILARTRMSDQIRLEVKKAFLDQTAASEALTVAQASVASAEENFRLVKKRYDASAATSFDVVDAEGLLTQARGQMQTALYNHAIARAALRRAMGEAPEKIAAQ